MPQFEIIRSDRKTIALEITRKGALVVRAPRRMKYDDIEAFVTKNRAWIEKNLPKENAVSWKSGEKSDAELRALAEQTIPPKVQIWAQRMQLQPSGVKITRAQTRYGSCSPKNSLCFSQYIMEYPEEAIDYVIVHELAHIKYKNHGREFYALVAQYLPDYQRRSALLKS